MRSTQSVLQRIGMANESAKTHGDEGVLNEEVRGAIVLESALLDQKSNNYLVAVVQEGLQVGLRST